MSAEAQTIEPHTRLRPGAGRGTPVEIDGQEWVLADHVPALHPVWDTLFDHNLLAGRYEEGALLAASIRLLYANYDLTPDEAATVITRAPYAALVPAVETALFGPEQTHRTWSDWVAASLAANGLRFEDVPSDRLHAVLDLLVRTGRTVPAGDFISSAEAAAVRQRVLDMAGGGR